MRAFSKTLTSLTGAGLLLVVATTPVAPANKTQRHPIHPMLIVFPLGLLGTAVAFDIVGLSEGDASWPAAPYPRYPRVPAGIQVWLLKKEPKQ
jgi:hypothetical protein